MPTNHSFSQKVLAQELSVRAIRGIFRKVVPTAIPPPIIASTDEAPVETSSWLFCTEGLVPGGRAGRLLDDPFLRKLVAMSKISVRYRLVTFDAH
jgi:hypothetical protein